MGKRSLQSTLENLMEQKSLLGQSIRTLKRLDGEKYLTSYDLMNEKLDEMVADVTSALEEEMEKESMLTRQRALDRYNSIVEAEGCRDLTIGTVYSRGTKGWNVADMVMEVRNLMFKLGASGYGMRGARYCRMWSFIRDFEGIDTEPTQVDHGEQYQIRKATC